MAPSAICEFFWVHTCLLTMMSMEDTTIQVPAAIKARNTRNHPDDAVGEFGAPVLVAPGRCVLSSRGFLSSSSLPIFTVILEGICEQERVSRSTHGALDRTRFFTSATLAFHGALLLDCSPAQAQNTYQGTKEGRTGCGNGLVWSGTANSCPTAWSFNAGRIAVQCAMRTRDADALLVSGRVSLWAQNGNAGVTEMQPYMHTCMWRIFF